MTRLQRMYRRKDLPQFAGGQRTLIDEEMKAGRFPRPVPLTDGGRAMGWLEDDLIAWQQARIARRDGESVPATPSTPKKTASKRQREEA